MDGYYTVPNYIKFISNTMSIEHHTWVSLLTANPTVYEHVTITVDDRYGCLVPYNPST